MLPLRLPNWKQTHYKRKGRRKACIQIPSHICTFLSAEGLWCFCVFSSRCSKHSEIILIIHTSESLPRWKTRKIARFLASNRNHGEIHHQKSIKIPRFRGEVFHHQVHRCTSAFATSKASRMPTEAAADSAKDPSCRDVGRVGRLAWFGLGMKMRMMRMISSKPKWCACLEM